MFARDLRKRGTRVETLLWGRLRSGYLGEKFRRQVEIGMFVVDFCCFSRKLIIELDGGIHRNHERKMIDLERTRLLEEMGYKVIRFWNSEVMNDIDGVVGKIKMALTLSK